MACRQCRAGCFRAGTEHFQAAAKRLSDLVKNEAVDLAADERVCYYEVASLYGAMCQNGTLWLRQRRWFLGDGMSTDSFLLDEAGFVQQDILSAIARLANTRPHRAPDPRTFCDWLVSKEWACSGSASGHVNYRLTTPDGDVRGRFKAQKNLVCDVIPTTKLEAKAWSYDLQDNVASIKTKLGKIRLAISSPLETYLAHAWIFRLAGDICLGWPGNTLEEPVWMEMSRLEDTWQRLQNGEHSLPYDFAESDQ